MTRQISASAVLCFLASSTQATLVGLQWSGNSQQRQVQPMDSTATIQFYVHVPQISPFPEDLVDLQTVQLVLHAWADQACTIPLAGVAQLDTVPLVPGWSVHGSNADGPVNQGQMAAVSGPDVTLPEVKTLLMAIEIRGESPGLAYLTIDWERDPDIVGTSLVNAAGFDYMTDAYWDGRAGYADTYANYWAFGDWGNPGWHNITKCGVYMLCGDFGQPIPEPLILEVVPEPAALALLALGGVALLRRR